MSEGLTVFTGSHGSVGPGPSFTAYYSTGYVTTVLSKYLEWTPSVTTDRGLWTVNFWLRGTRDAEVARKGIFGARNVTNQSTEYFCFCTNYDNDSITENRFSTGDGTGYQGSATWTDNVWQNWHVMWDTAQVSTFDRARLWINGIEGTPYTQSGHNQDDISRWMHDRPHYIGTWPSVVRSGWDGDIGLFHCVADAAVAVTEFLDGTGGSAVGKRYTGAYGANGFRLEFAGTGASLGNDSSGNGNNWSNIGSLTRGDKVDGPPVNFDPDA